MPVAFSIAFGSSLKMKKAIKNVVTDAMTLHVIVFSK